MVLITSILVLWFSLWVYVLEFFPFVALATHAKTNTKGLVLLENSTG